MVCRDSNNGFPHRYATVLAYLNDVGWCDVFSHSRDRARGQGRGVRLLAAGYTHTDAAVRQDDDEGRLVTHARSGKRLSTHARRCPRDDDARTAAACGSAEGRRGGCVWSLGDDGAVDPASWHGGARVVGGEVGSSYFENGKWTLRSTASSRTNAARTGPTGAAQQAPGKAGKAGAVGARRARCYAAR